MTEETQLVIFILDGRPYALPLEAVERVVQAVALTPLPGSPDFVLGIVNLAGDIIPVLDVRRRFGLEPRGIELSDQFIIAKMGARRIALLVDEARRVVSCPRNEINDAQQLIPGSGEVGGAFRLDDEIVLVQDLERAVAGVDWGRLPRALAG